MRYLIIINIIFTIAIFSETIYSQSSFYMDMGLGLNVPVIESDFADSYNIGFHIGASGGITFNKFVSSRANIYYKNFLGKDLPPGASASFTSVTFSTDIMVGDFEKKSNINPYGFAGLVIYFLSVSSKVKYYGITIEASDSENKFGFEVGGGINFKLSNKFGIFGETMLNYIFNEGTAKGYLPIRVGARLNF